LVSVHFLKPCHDREIHPDKAPIVRRIFQEFAAGRSPRQIAIGLNRDGIPAPGGQGWSQSTSRTRHGDSQQRAL
jgi:hypothetical protein